jgi:translation initiation factor IF-2
MTDPETSGAAANAAPAETGGAPTAAASASQFGTFGSARGSGLARGKRAVTAAPAASAATGEYKPTAIEVVVPQREYKNPFGESIPVVEPAAAIPAPAPAPAPAAPALAAAPAPVAQVAAPAKDKVLEKAEIPEKAELNILPPAEAKRPPVHWGNSPTAGDSAPVFQTRARREERRDGGSSFRDEPKREPSYEAREPRREPRPEQRFERRDPMPQREAARPPVPPPAPVKSRGFFAWLKGLFAGKPAAKPTQGEVTHREGDQFRRRRRRGGRGRRHGEGHHGQSGPPREGGQSDFRGGHSDYRGGGNEGGGNRDGQRRRRHRGGRDRGDRGHSGPEGWQGGGAI